MAGKFPICNYNQEIYADWLLENSQSLNVQKASGTASVIGGLIATGFAVASAIVTGGATLPAVRSCFRWTCNCSFRWCYDR